MAVDEEGKVIGRPEDFIEFKWKYGDRLLEVFKDKQMVEDFIYLLDEYANFYSERVEIEKLLERMFQYMIKYQYQPESQSISYIKCMVHASYELRLWRDVANSLWDYDIREDTLEYCYLFARKYLLIKIMRPKCIELDKVAPKTNPYKYTLDEYAEYEIVKEFCKIHANTNLPEIVEYVKNM